MNKAKQHIETCNDCGEKITEQPKPNRKINLFGDEVEVPVHACGCGKEFFKIREALDDLTWRRISVGDGRI